MATAMIAPPKAGMSNLGGTTRFFTVAEYLAREESAAVRHEYRSGEIVEMAGATEEHGIIVGNVTAEFVVQLRQSPCRVVPADLRVRVPNSQFYTYPDAVVVCEASIREGITLLNPTLIAEVLSDSTEAYDRGEKFARYQELASLTDYILISQNRPRIEHFARQADASWLYQAADGADATLRIASCRVTLRLRDIYDKVVFPAVGIPAEPEEGRTTV